MVDKIIGNWKAYLAEFLGTFVFVFISSGTVLTSTIFGDLGALAIATATGIALAVMIFATAAISGGHLNPAVTLAMWLSGRISLLKAFFYLSAQFAASFAAAFCLFLIFGSKSINFFLGGPFLAVGVSVQSAVILEAILTGVLVFAVYASMVDKRGPGSFGPLIVGLVVLVSGIFAGPLTGAALNPARAIGPLVISGNYSQILVYLIGPFVGSLAGIFYEFMFLKSSSKKKS